MILNQRGKGELPNISSTAPKGRSRVLSRKGTVGLGEHALWWYVGFDDDDDDDEERKQNNWEEGGWEKESF